jgi:hypothetical protein
MAIISFLSNDKLEQREAEAMQQAAEPLFESVMSELARHVRTQWETNKEYKQEIERHMLEDLRQRNGVYDPDVMSQIGKMGGSEIFMRLTATKCRSALSWITDILLPAGDKAWSIEPTPVPELSREMQVTAQQMSDQIAMKMQQQGQQVSPDQLQELDQITGDKLLSKIREHAEKASDKMEDLIEDQLIDSGWQDALMEFLDDFVTFPAAIIKGPVYRVEPKLSWGPEGQPIVEHAVVPKDQRVSPFDIFPSPGAIDVDDGNLIERMHYTRTDLYNMIGVPGYDEMAIREVLQEHTDGYLTDWETASEDEIKRVSTGISNHRHTDGLITALHYWGTASGKALMDWGVGCEDPQMEYQIEAILVGRHIIRAAINEDPLNRRPYYKACFQNKPGSFWGDSIPRLMRDIQRMCNATARALSNNMGMSSGPQVVIMKDMMAKGETVTSLYPWKQWQMTTNPAGPNQPPISFFQPQSNAGQLLQVYEYFEQKADDATNIPRYAYGNEKVAGAGQTAQGLAMLLESATKGIKQAIRHIDHHVIEKRILRQYHENMLYEEDQSIKGDLKVVARGSTALIAKAATQARRNEFLQITGNEVDAQIIGLEGRADLLRQMVRDMDMPDIIPEAEEIQQKMQQKAQQGQQDPKVQLEMLRAKNAMEIEQFRAQQAAEDRKLKRNVALLERESDMLELAARRDISLEQIKAKLGETSIRERGARQRIADEAQIKARFGSGI